MALTARKVETAAAGRYSDGQGLTLLVKPSGARSWVLRVQVDGKRRDIGLGSYPALSLADARESAREVHHLPRRPHQPWLHRHLRPRRPDQRGVFKAWLEQMLALELRPGDIVVMDNLAAHKVAGIREAIEARSAELRYLPRYSPDLNPIEQAFAKLKALLRKAAERTVDGLWTTIGSLRDLVPPDECANDLANSGCLQSA